MRVNTKEILNQLLAEGYSHDEILKAVKSLKAKFTNKEK